LLGYHNKKLDNFNFLFYLKSNTKPKYQNALDKIEKLCFNFNYLKVLYKFVFSSENNLIAV